MITPDFQALQMAGAPPNAQLGWQTVRAAESAGRSAYDYVSNKVSSAKDFLTSAKDQISGLAIPLIEKADAQTHSARGVSSMQLKPQTIDYLNADLAKHYGMSSSTAYQEALSNTAYQRAVKDMQAAGLNPAAIFGNGRGSTAGGVSYVSPAGSGGSSYGSGAAGGQDSGLFSRGVYNALAIVGGLAAMKASPKPFKAMNFITGSNAAKTVMSMMNGIF